MLDLNLLIHGFLIGLIISILEIIFVHSDEEVYGLGVWLKHGWHTFPFTIGGTILSLLIWYSYDFVASFIPILIPKYVLYFIFFIVITIVVHAKAAITRGVGETWVHCMIISLLITLAPLYYPFIALYLPRFF